MVKISYAYKQTNKKFRARERQREKKYLSFLSFFLLLNVNAILRNKKNQTVAGSQ